MRLIFGSLLTTLLLSAALVPRELNIRTAGFSFSVTDILFLAFIAAGSLLVLSRTELRKTAFGRPGILLLIAIAAVFSIALIDANFKGIGNRHIFFRDIYVLSSFLLTAFFAYAVGADKRRVLGLIVFSNIVLAFAAIFVVNVPPVAHWYVETARLFEVLGGVVGYAMPSNGTTGAILDIGRVRPAVFIGGVGHVGWLTILCVPVFFEYHEELRERYGAFFISAALILILLSFLYLMSKAALLGLALSTILWLWFSTARPNTKARCMTYVIAAFLILHFTGNLNLLTKRFAEMSPLKKSVMKHKLKDGARWPTSTDVRVKLYKNAAQQIGDDALLGLGMGNLFKVTIYRDEFIDWTDEFDGVDSFYLTLILKMGVFGLLYIFIFFYFAYQYHSRVKAGGSGFSPPAFFALSGILFAGLFGYFLQSPSFNIILGIVLGLAAREGVGLDGA